MSIPKQERFQGVFTVLCMPFDDDEQIDEQSLRRLTRFQLAVGVSGIVVGGLASEVDRFTPDERTEITSIVVDEVRGQVPVVSGAGHNSTRVAVEIARAAGRAGTDAVMVLPAGSANEAVDYYARIADAAEVPVIIQDAPSESGVELSAQKVAEIHSAVPSVQYIKVETGIPAMKVAAVVEMVPEMTIFGGLGGLFLPDELAAGATGTMPGCAYPEPFIEVLAAHRQGDTQRLLAAHSSVLPMTLFSTQGKFFVHIQKEIMRRAGVFTSARLRHPATPLPQAMLDRLDFWLAARPLAIFDWQDTLNTTERDLQ